MGLLHHVVLPHKIEVSIKMMISTRGRYALRVMIDLAEQNSDGYVSLREIAQRQEISEKYLETIVRFLTQEGLVSGVRGKGGGYRLTRKPEDYTAAEILKVAELSLSPVACLEKGAAPCPRADRCRTLPLWKGLDQVVDDYLSHYTLRNLMDQAHQAQEAGE